MQYLIVNCPWCGAPSDERQALNVCKVCNNQYSVTPPNTIAKVHKDYNKELLERLIDKTNAKEV